MSRDTQLRHAQVMDGHFGDFDSDDAYARHVLHQAWVAVEATGEPVKLESGITEGDPVGELVEISRTTR